MVGKVPLLATKYYQRCFLVLRGLFYIFWSRGGKKSNPNLKESADKIDA
jgi:hypothetical protein